MFVAGFGSSSSSSCRSLPAHSLLVCGCCPGRRPPVDPRFPICCACFLFLSSCEHRLVVVVRANRFASGVVGRDAIKTRVRCLFPWVSSSFFQDAFDQHVYMERWERLPGGRGPFFAIRRRPSRYSFGVTARVASLHLKENRSKDVRSRYVHTRTKRVQLPEPRSLCSLTHSVCRR